MVAAVRPSPLEVPVSKCSLCLCRLEYKGSPRLLSGIIQLCRAHGLVDEAEVLAFAATVYTLADGQRQRKGNLKRKPHKLWPHITIDWFCEKFMSKVKICDACYMSFKNKYDQFRTCTFEYDGYTLQPRVGPSWTNLFLFPQAEVEKLATIGGPNWLFNGNRSTIVRFIRSDSIVVALLELTIQSAGVELTVQLCTRAYRRVISSAEVETVLEGWPRSLISLSGVSVGPSAIVVVHALSGARLCPGYIQLVDESPHTSYSDSCTGIVLGRYARCRSCRNAGRRYTRAHSTSRKVVGSSSLSDDPPVDVIDDIFVPDIVVSNDMLLPIRPTEAVSFGSQLEESVGVEGEPQLDGDNVEAHFFDVVEDEEEGVLESFSFDQFIKWATEAGLLCAADIAWLDSPSPPQSDDPRVMLIYHLKAVNIYCQGTGTDFLQLLLATSALNAGRNTRSRYPEEVLHFSRALYVKGRRVFEALRPVLGLPSTRHIRMLKPRANPGIQYASIAEAEKTHAGLQNLVLSLDAMFIRKGLLLRNDEFYGFVSSLEESRVGSGSDSPGALSTSASMMDFQLVLAKQLLAFVVTGTKQKADGRFELVSFPVACFPFRSLTTDVLCTMVLHVLSSLTKFDIQLIVADSYAAHRSAFRYLSGPSDSIGTQRHNASLLSPFKNECRLFVMYDIIHICKRLRNVWSNGKYSIRTPAGPVRWGVLKELVAEDGQQPFEKRLYGILACDFELNSWDRMSVPALQRVTSNKIFLELARRGGMRLQDGDVERNSYRVPLPPVSERQPNEYSGTAWYIDFIRKVYLLADQGGCRASTFISAKQKDRRIREIRTVRRMLSEMEGVIVEIKHDLEVTLDAFEGLISGFTRLSHCTTDPCERVFSSARAQANRNPSVIDATHALRDYGASKSRSVLGLHRSTARNSAFAIEPQWGIVPIGRNDDEEAHLESVNNVYGAPTVRDVIANTASYGVDDNGAHFINIDWGQVESIFRRSVGLIWPSRPSDSPIQLFLDHFRAILLSEELLVDIRGFHILLGIATSFLVFAQQCPRPDTTPMLDSVLPISAQRGAIPEDVRPMSHAAMYSLEYVAGWALSSLPQSTRAKFTWLKMLHDDPRLGGNVMAVTEKSPLTTPSPHLFEFFRFLDVAINEWMRPEILDVFRGSGAMACSRALSQSVQLWDRWSAGLQKLEIAVDAVQSREVQKLVCMKVLRARAADMCKTVSEYNRGAFRDALRADRNVQKRKATEPHVNTPRSKSKTASPASADAKSGTGGT